MTSFALTLAFIMRFTATRKWSNTFSLHHRRETNFSHATENGLDMDRVAHLWLKSIDLIFALSNYRNLKVFAVLILLIISFSFLFLLVTGPRPSEHLAERNNLRLQQE